MERNTSFEFINKYNPEGQKRDSNLRKVRIYEQIGFLEKIVNFIKWDWYAVFGGFLMFLVLIKGKGMVTLLLWWWYCIWAYIGSFGFTASWVVAPEYYWRVFHGHMLNHYATEQFMHFHWALFALVPALFIFKGFVYFLINAIPDFFGDIEKKIGFSRKNRNEEIKV